MVYKRVWCALLFLLQCRLAVAAPDIWPGKKPVRWSILSGFSNRIKAVRFSPDGELLGVRDGAGVVIYDVKAKRQIVRLERPYNISLLCFTPDKKKIVGVRSEHVPTDIAVWNVRSGKILFALKSHQGGMPWASVELPSDGKSKQKMEATLPATIARNNL